MATATIPAKSQAAPVVPSRTAVRTGWPEFVRAPALVGAGGFAAGILCAHFFWFRTGWLFVALLASFVIAAVSSRVAVRLAWPSVALVYVVLGMLCAEIAPAVNRQQELRLRADNSPRLVQGEVIRLGPVRRVMSSTPFSAKTHEERSQQIDIRLDSLPGSISEGGVRVTLYAPIEQDFPGIACGDQVRATLAMHVEERFLDPGVWDAGEYLLRQGIGALASAKPEKFAVIATGRPGVFSCRLHSLQLEAGSRLIDFADQANDSRMPGFLRISHSDAAMLTAMLTGDRGYLQRGVRVGFERTGSFHLLVVSGLHLAIFSGMIFWLARRVRLSRVWASVVTIACSFGYALFTGFGHPVERAFWMVTL